LREADIAIPINLMAAKQYVRLSTVTVSKTGTHTPTVPILAATFILGGLVLSPATAYVEAGYLAYQTP
jgi:hypothetical protein